MKRLLDSRWGLAVVFLLIALLLPLFLGLSLIPAGMEFWTAVYAMFVLVGAPGVVSAALLVLTPIKEDFSYGFGCGLYYGSCAIYLLTIKLGWSMPEFSRFLLGFVIAALVCYIVWLDKYKYK